MGRWCPSPKALERTDRLLAADETVQDFWRWAFSDLRDGTQRGVLAELLVALAHGRTHADPVPFSDLRAAPLRRGTAPSPALRRWGDART